MKKSSSKILNIIGPVKPEIDCVDPNLFTIFVDGGNAFKTEFFAKSLSIGDNDSYRERLDIQLDPDKLWGDLYFAIKEMAKLKVPAAKLYGFVGGRLDHQILLLGDLLRLSQDHAFSFEIFDKQELRMEILPPGDFARSFSGAFSLFTLYEQKVLFKGDCRYPPDKEYPQLILPFSTNGLSNFCASRIELETEKSICVYYV